MAPLDTRPIDPLDFVHGLRWQDLPPHVQHQARRCLLDLLGVAAGGLGTRLSGIIRDMAAEDMPGTVPMMFDARSAAPAGAALAMGMTIDSLDGHDGYNPCKGHIGCSLLPGLLVFGGQSALSGAEFLTALVMGYEFGARVSVAQHATCPDFHTSGSWGAVVVAAAGARLRKFGRTATRHALGIAEYHGPRSQMMRCIDHPTMLKDGSGWGALAGVTAVQMAARGFTGAPALTVEHAAEHWGDLGRHWSIGDQYFKPYPVCRWAQAPVEAVLALRQAHGIVPGDVAALTIETFHEACRLATARPATTEEAQYSTSFPCAVALVRGALTPGDVADDALEDPEILRISTATRMIEHDMPNSVFPQQRFARVCVTLKSGTVLRSDWMQPRWSHDDPPSDAELTAKFHTLADPVLGVDRAAAIRAAVLSLDATPLTALTDLLYAPPG